MVLISGTIAAALACAALVSLLVGSGIGVTHVAYDRYSRDVKAGLNASRHHAEQLRSLQHNLTRLLNQSAHLTTKHDNLQQGLFQLVENSQNLSNSIDLILNLTKEKPKPSLPYGFHPVMNRGAPKQSPSRPQQLTRPKRRYRRSSPWTEPAKDAGRLTVITDNASVEPDDRTSQSYQTKVLESGLIAPNLGLVMEQSGTYMEYSGYIYVPLIYHMPHLATTGAVGRGTACNISINADHQKMIVGLLKDKIGVLVPHHSARRKRFIATLVLGGAVAWNRASIWSLQDTVASLEEQLANMRTNQQVVTESINTLIDNQHAVYHAVDRQARILKEFMEETHCEELITNYFREVYSTWLSLAPNDFSRVVDGALSGKITPDMLPATDVVSTLLKHPAMVSTAYSRDMTLLYELGKFALHEVNYDPYPMISGVMVFPRILPDRSAALMRVYTTHLPMPGGFRKLILPDAVACKNRGTCWHISPTTCKEMLTLTLCPKQSRPDFNRCINQLVSNKTATKCSWAVSNNPSLEVVQFDGGVLVSASNISGQIMVNQGKELVVHREVDPSDSPFVLTSADGDYLHIGGQIYQLSQETIRTGYEIVINMTVPEIHESLEGIAVEGWVDQSAMQLMKEKPWVPPHHYTWWVVVGIAVTLLLLIMLMIRHRVSLAHLKRKVVEEVSGWMAIPTVPVHNPPPIPSNRGRTNIIV